MRDYSVAANRQPGTAERFPWAVIYDGQAVSFHTSKESAERTCARLRATSFLPSRKRQKQLLNEAMRVRKSGAAR